MKTKGRLVRSFPGPAIATSLDRMADPSFREALAHLVTSLDSCTPNESWPVVVKAKSKVAEVRDTVHPKFVTEMLAGFLRGIGQPLDVARIYKRTRDDVLSDNALKPWRRSSLWLLLRVVLQTSLMADRGDHERYKSFMIFFMARLLERALQTPSPSDILFVMAAKISRRVLKLNIGDELPWMQYACGIVKATHQELANRWAQIENPGPLGLQGPGNASQLSFIRDTRLSLSNLQPYLASISARPALSSEAPEYEPGCLPRIDQDSSKFPLSDFRMLNAGCATHLRLMDLELWVQESLDVWLRTNLASDRTCTLLAELIQEYTTAASSTYAESPEDISMMLLTTLDLWVALDKCTTYQHPLLCKYEPGFPSSLFDPLLLPKRAQMERLFHVEQYIQQRMHESTHRSSLIFQDTNQANSFAVRYFEQSLGHQELRRQIETAAACERAQKKEELEEKKLQHRRLLQEFNARTHDEITAWNDDGEYSYHSSGRCEKCRLKEEADNLQITVHEWPLPYIELEAKSAVFELNVPVAIAKWRDITCTLLVDVFSPPRPGGSGCSKIYSLYDFDGLRSYKQCQEGRLQLASETKPFVVAHYGTKKIPQATKSLQCMEHLHFPASI
jgi:hypothetical protein